MTRIIGIRWRIMSRDTSRFDSAMLCVPVAVTVCAKTSPFHPMRETRNERARAMPVSVARQPRRRRRGAGAQPGRGDDEDRCAGEPRALRGMARRSVLPREDTADDRRLRALENPQRPYKRRRWKSDQRPDRYGAPLLLAAASEQPRALYRAIRASPLALDHEKGRPFHHADRRGVRRLSYVSRYSSNVPQGRKSTLPRERRCGEGSRSA